jgi:hypothetical protein
MELNMREYIWVHPLTETTFYSKREYLDFMRNRAASRRTERNLIRFRNGLLEKLMKVQESINDTEINQFLNDHIWAIEKLAEVAIIKPFKFSSTQNRITYGCERTKAYGSLSYTVAHVTVRDDVNAVLEKIGIIIRGGGGYHHNLSYSCELSPTSFHTFHTFAELAA